MHRQKQTILAHTHTNKHTHRQTGMYTRTHTLPLTHTCQSADQAQSHNIRWKICLDLLFRKEQLDVFCYEPDAANSGPLITAKRVSTETSFDDWLQKHENRFCLGEADGAKGRSLITAEGVCKTASFDDTLSKKEKRCICVHIWEPDGAKGRPFIAAERVGATASFDDWFPVFGAVLFAKNCQHALFRICTSFFTLYGSLFKVCRSLFTCVCLFLKYTGRQCVLQKTISTLFSERALFSVLMANCCHPKWGANDKFAPQTKLFDEWPFKNRAHLQKQLVHVHYLPFIFWMYTDMSLWKNECKWVHKTIRTFF